MAAAWLVAGQLEREARLKFESAVSDAKATIGTRVSDYADVLRGVSGLFAAMNTVSRAEFARYLQNLELGKRYPGIQVIHYSRRITDAERPAFEATVRADTSVDPRGYPNFAIRPRGTRPEYVVATYVEPMAGNERALGLDLGGDPVRLAALERTRDSGRITASGTIALALDPARHPGFAMRLAIYRKDAPVATVEERRAAFSGVVSASFVAIDLMRGVLSDALLQKVHVRIHDAGFLGSRARPDGAERRQPDVRQRSPERQGAGLAGGVGRGHAGAAHRHATGGGRAALEPLFQRAPGVRRRLRPLVAVAGPAAEVSASACCCSAWCAPWQARGGARSRWPRA